MNGARQLQSCVATRWLGVDTRGHNLSEERGSSGGGGRRVQRLRGRR